MTTPLRLPSDRLPIHTLVHTNHHQTFTHIGLQSCPPTRARILQHQEAPSSFLANLRLARGQSVARDRLLYFLPLRACILRKRVGLGSACQGSMTVLVTRLRLKI